jgi:hypothetical protein
MPLASTEHLKRNWLAGVSASVAEKRRTTFCPLRTDRRPRITGFEGSVVSTIQFRTAGVESTLSISSLARTDNVWRPSSSAISTGLVHARHSSWSSLHSKVSCVGWTASSLPVNSKVCVKLPTHDPSRGPPVN